MNRFGNLITSLMAERKLTAKEVSHKTGIAEAMISKWRHGKRRFVSTDDLARLAMLLGRNKKERAEIVAARFQDECDQMGIHVNIAVNGASAKETSTASIKRRLVEMANSL